MGKIRPQRPLAPGALGFRSDGPGSANPVAPGILICFDNGGPAAWPPPLFTKTQPLAHIHITDLEDAINYWRARADVRTGQALAPELDALAQVYAVMALEKRSVLDEAELDVLARAAWLAWYQTTPDTPCIAICSTAQGDAQCKGCGRSFDEVQHWLSMTPVEKRWVWARIRSEGTAWRFTRYAERAVESIGESLPNL